MVERGGGLKAAYVAEEWAVREASPQLDSAASTVRPAVTLGPVSPAQQQVGRGGRARRGTPFALR